MSEAEVIRCAGVDAAMYLKILRMGGWVGGWAVPRQGGLLESVCGG